MSWTITEFLTVGRRIVADGWCQERNQRKTETGFEYCALGALNKAVRDNWLEYDRLSSWSDITRALRQAIPEGFERWDWGDPIVAYNDTKGRTQQEVLEWFDRAIQMQEADS